MDRSKWEYKKWADVLNIINGRDYKEVAAVDGAYPICGSGGEIGRASEYLCPENTVIIGRKGNINKPIFIEEKFWNIDTAFGLVAKSSYLIPRFLFYFCLHYDFERHNKAVTIPSLTKGDLLKIDMLLPSLSDQQRIVSELDCLNEMIALKQGQLKEFDKLAQSIFYDMFGDPSVMSEDNMNNVCETITDFVAAGSFASLRENVVYESLPSFAQLVRTVDLKSNFIKGNYVYVNESAFNFLWRVNLNKESIILPNVGVNCGEVYYIHPSMLPFKNNVLGPNAILVRSNTHNHIYLAYYFMSQDFQIQIKKITNAVGQPKFNKTELKKLRVLLPPLALQQQFAEKIQAIEAQKELVKKSIAETQQLLDSRMDYYFD